MSRMSRVLGTLFMGVAVLSMVTAASAERLEPKDTAAAAPGFAQFRQRLLEAVKRRDARFVESVVADDVKFSFGGQSGRASFLAAFRLRNPRSPFWAEMERLLRMAGAYDPREKTVWHPCFFRTWPEKVDAFTHAVAVGSRVAVHREAKVTSPVVATLNHDIVDIGGRGAWMKVTTPSGQVGYVKADDLYFPVSRRAAFQQIHGAWRLTVYVEGD